MRLFAFVLVLVSSCARPALGFAAHSSSKSSSASASSSWSPADDWARLSSESQTMDTDALLGADLTGEAARKMEEEAAAAAADLAAANAASAATATPNTASPEEDAHLAAAIEAIQNSLIVDPTDPPLYDSPSSLEGYHKSDDALEEEREASEIGMLIRCNETPKELLVSEGRALADLADEQRYDWRQMIRIKTKEEEKDGDVVVGTSGSRRYEPTDFFRLAVLQMFHEHATTRTVGNNREGDEKELERTVLNADGVASWLTKSLGDETYGPIGRHAKEVGTILARYGSYGTGFLTEEQFHQLYVEAIVSAVDVEQKNKVARKKKKVAGSGKMTEVTVDSVWRDLRNHDILPPAEVEWQRKKAEMDAEYSNNGRVDNTNADATSSLASSSIYDECEILDWGGNDEGGARSPASVTLQRASHESIEMCSDGKTPKRIRDGMAVFVDEESCIGCMQCATVAPSAFVMLENGRARAFHQSSSPEIKAAVASCPVNCMHYVGIEELIKFETARDGANFGGRAAHIPLHVAGIDSDQNRKSSWYHSLRHKCYTSKQCPQAGCYDCPNYSSPGQNPYFQAKNRKAEHSRAMDLIESGEADAWRKSVEL